MGLFEKLFGRLTGKKTTENEVTDQELIEAGACPNCWGRQEYDNQFFEFVEDQTKANINKDKSHQKAFVQQFIEDNITGIRLKREGDQVVCHACNGKYKHISSKTS
jgi:hypothetical protein